MPKSAKSKCSYCGKYFATNRGCKVHAAKSHNGKPPSAPKLKPQLRVDVDIDRISIASLDYSTTLGIDRSSELSENLSSCVGILARSLNQGGHDQQKNAISKDTSRPSTGNTPTRPTSPKYTWIVNEEPALSSALLSESGSQDSVYFEAQQRTNTKLQEMESKMTRMFQEHTTSVQQWLNGASRNLVMQSTSMQWKLESQKKQLENLEAIVNNRLLSLDRSQAEMYNKIHNMEEKSGDDQIKFQVKVSLQQLDSTGGRRSTSPDSVLGVMSMGRRPSAQITIVD